MIFCRQYQRSFNQTIHPDSQENVQNVRQERQPRESSRTRDGQQLTCPICLGEAQFAIETNCSHVYCGKPEITYGSIHGYFLKVSCMKLKFHLHVLIQVSSIHSILQTDLDNYVI